MSEREPCWTIDADEVIRRLETNPDEGLRSAVAIVSLERYGGNVLATLHRTPWYTDMAQSGLRTLASARRRRARRRSDWAREVWEDTDGAVGGTVAEPPTMFDTTFIRWIQDPTISGIRLS